jgi:hypothetical protein
MGTEGERIDALLTAMRAEADPPADRVLAALIAEGGIGAANAALGRFSREDVPLAAGAPPALAAFLAEQGSLPAWADMGKIARAQRLFTSQGPGFGLVLMAESLPCLYAGGKGGAQTLYGTGQLSGHFRRRASQTLRFILNVMEPGSLAPGGKGVASILKVRLMHAAIRNYVGRSEIWKGKTDDWGLPINQVELAGTLLAFSSVALDGLRKLGLHISADDKEAYLHAWTAIGTVLGIRAELLPGNIREAGALWRRIVATQFVPSPEGRELARDHLRFLEELMPGDLLDGFPPTLMYFLMGRKLARRQLGLPGPGWTILLILILRRLIFLEGRIIMRSAALGRLASEAGKELMESLYRSWNRGDGSPFRIPDTLRATS